MSDIKFDITTSDIVFDIAEEQPISFIVLDPAISFSQPVQDLTFDISEDAIEFHLGAGVTIVNNVLPYAVQADIVSDNLIYKGEAFPGTLVGQSFWRISRVTILPNEDVIIEWADGESNFVHDWNNRASLTYF